MAMKQAYMVRDAEQEMFDASVAWWPVATYDSTAIDLGAADGDMEDPGIVVVQFRGLTSGGAATIALSLLDCDTLAGSYAVLTPVQVLVPATAFDNALWADTIYMPVPDFGVRRFLKLRCIVAVANITAGTLDAWYTKRSQ